MLRHASLGLQRKANSGRGDLSNSDALAPRKGCRGLADYQVKYFLRTVTTVDLVIYVVTDPSVSRVTTQNVTSTDEIFENIQAQLPGVLVAAWVI